MGRPVVHWEFWSASPDRISKFYEQAFDWQSQHVPDLNYWMVNTGGTGGINGGIMTPQDGHWPGKLAFYIDVDDLAASLARVTSAGGQVLVDRQEIPGMGAIALFSDPDGRVVGLWKAAAPTAAPAPAKKAKGAAPAKTAKRAKPAKSVRPARRAAKKRTARR
jgi:predicted enzyme related to lactoylglutathione lyase